MGVTIIHTCDRCGARYETSNPNERYLDAGSLSLTHLGSYRLSDRQVSKDGEKVCNECVSDLITRLMYTIKVWREDV